MNEPVLDECSACAGEGRYETYYGHAIKCEHCGGKGVEWVETEPVDCWDLMSEEEFEALINQRLDDVGHVEQ